MMDDGIISPAEAEDHPDANIINRALGAKPEVTPEVSGEPLPVQPDDLFMLCTDGLCGLVRDDEIAAFFGRGDSMETISDNLVAAALQKGGHDNVTVQIVRFENEGVPFKKPETEVKPTGTADNITSKATVVLIILLAALIGAGLWWYLSHSGGR